MAGTNGQKLVEAPVLVLVDVELVGQ